MKRKIVALLSDMHGGHNLGLCNPETQILDTAENPPIERGVTIGAWQNYLWHEIYIPAVEQIAKLAGKDEIIVNHLGDLTQGGKYIEHLVVPDVGNQCRVAYHNFSPWLSLKNVKRIRLASGTPAHIGENLGVPVVVSNMIASRHTVDCKVAHHMEQDVLGYCIDIAHHGAHPGIRSYLRGNSMRYEMRSFLIECYMSGETPPDMLARAHFHVPLEETITERINDRMVKFTYLLIPSMTGMSSYARKATKSQPKVTNGLCALEIVDGKLVDIHWYIKTVDTRVKEQL